MGQPGRVAASNHCEDAPSSSLRVNGPQRTPPATPRLTAVPTPATVCSFETTMIAPCCIQARCESAPILSLQATPKCHEYSSPPSDATIRPWTHIPSNAQPDCSGRHGQGRRDQPGEQCREWRGASGGWQVAATGSQRLGGDCVAIDLSRARDRRRARKASPGQRGLKTRSLRPAPGTASL